MRSDAGRAAQENRQEATAKRPRKRLRWYVIAGLLFLGFWLIGWLQTRNAPQSDDVGAVTICEQFVTARLKSPSTAKFPWINETRTVKQPDGSYRVTAWVDSQNAFGATLRANWTCEVRPNGPQRWKLVDLKMAPR